MEPLYRDSFLRSHRISEVIEHFDGFIADEGRVISLAGRVIAKRIMGKVAFANVFDGEATIQIYLDARTLGPDGFRTIVGSFKIGDIIGLSGTAFLTKTQEKTIRCCDLELLSSSLRSLPEKFHGLSDVETRYRQRYLDLIANMDARTTFARRSKMIRAIRRFMEAAEFIEVETPVFQKNPCGASANPFVTHHNAKGIDLFLRISPETYLKQLIVGGMDRIFEIGRNFRNEGVDASHLQEFTMLEFYASYWNFRNSIDFTKKLFEAVALEVTGSLLLEYQGLKLDFGSWQQVDYRQAVLDDCGIDVLAYDTVQGLRQEITVRGVSLGAIDSGISLGNLIDKLYKKVTRPRLVQPTILMNHPAVLIPLARPNDEDPRVIDSFQVLVNGWEMAKGYSELADPMLQRRLLEEQLALRQGGDEDAMFLDVDFLTALEYGMPPVSGVGIGIDRFAALVTNQRNLADVVLFPLMG